MQYRSDLGAALARVAALQRELAELRGEVSRPPAAPPVAAYPVVAAEIARLTREKAALEAELKAAGKRGDKAERALAGERETITELRKRLKDLETALELERAARLAVERELKTEGPAGKPSRTLASRRDALWRQATLATLVPAALLATSWDILRDAMHTQKRDLKNYAGALRMAKGGEPILVHPRAAGPGFAEVRVGPGMGEIMFTTQDAIVQPERPKRRKR